MAALSLCSDQEVHGLVLSGERWGLSPNLIFLTQVPRDHASQPSPQENDVRLEK